MRRRLFNILSALSLLVLVALGVLWARSSIAIDRVGIRIRQSPDPGESEHWRVTTQYEAMPLSGQICLSVSRIHGPTVGPVNGSITVRPTYLPEGWFWDTSAYDSGVASVYRERTVLGFGMRHDSYSFDGAFAGGWSIQLPLWFLLGLSLVWPWMWLRRQSQTRFRLAHGLCPECGYDLRAQHRPLPRMRNTSNRD